MRHLTRRIISSLLACGLALTGCSPVRSGGSHSSDDIRPEYVIRRARGAPGVIVFIHGIFGDPIGTWTAPNGAYWPKLLAEDAAFSSYDVYKVGYRSPKFETAYSIDEIADVVRDYFIADSVFTAHEEVIFVAHSMGGLVTRSLLNKSADTLAAKVRLLAFYGTPTNGSELATLFRTFSRNRQLRGMAPEAFAGFLNDQQRSWQSRGFARIPTFCAYETRASGSTLVVTMQSAAALCNRPLAPIDADHSGLVKPPDSRAQSYIVLRNALVTTDPVVRSPSPERNVVQPSPDSESLRESGVRANRADSIFVLATRSSDWNEFHSLMQSALADYRVAEALAPSNALYRISVGTVLNRLGRYEEAAIRLQEGIRLDPKQAWFHDELCVALSELKRYAEAEMPCREAVRLDPNNARFQDQLRAFLERAAAARAQPGN